jgi:spore germination protein KB
VITLLTVLTTLLSIPVMRPANLKPVLEHSVTELFMGSVSFGATAFLETVLILALLGNLKKNNSPYKTYRFGLIFGVLGLVSSALRNTTVLGKEISATAMFPSYTAVRVIGFGDFFEHMESLTSFNLILLGFTKAAICIYAASAGAAKLFGVDSYKKLVLPVSLLSLIACLTVFTNMQQLSWFTGDVYPLVAMVFAAVIPILIWIKSEAGKTTAQTGGTPDS